MGRVTWQGVPSRKYTVMHALDMLIEEVRRFHPDEDLEALAEWLEQEGSRAAKKLRRIETRRRAKEK